MHGPACVLLPRSAKRRLNLTNDVFDSHTGVDSSSYKPESVVNLTGSRRVFAKKEGCPPAPLFRRHVILPFCKGPFPVLHDGHCGSCSLAG